MYELFDILSIFVFILFVLFMCAFTESIVVSAISALIPTIIMKIISVYFKNWKIEYDDFRLIKYTLLNKPVEITFDKITAVHIVERKINTVTHKYLIISFEDGQTEISMNAHGTEDLHMFLKERFPKISEK